MANYYTLFSEMIGDLTDDERAWIKDRIEEHGQAQDGAACGYEDDDRVMDFDYDFEPEGDVEESHFWVYSEECGNIDCVCDFVQKFLAKFRPDQTWTMSYAFSCSKPRLDAFGGGKAKVTAQGWHACDGGCIKDWKPNTDKESSDAEAQ